MMFLELLETYPPFAVGFAALIGLLVGSFLNVVIYRLPVMMQHEENQAVAEFLHERDFPISDALTNTSQTKFNLATPASRCGNCGHNIRAWENIPVLSFILLRGRCKGCKTPISARYPSIELLTGALTALAIAHFGFNWQGCAIALLSWCLIALTMIDFDTCLLPDAITLPLLWTGLIFNYYGVIADFKSAFWGAIWGYLALWSVYHIFKLLFKKEGMGYGDFKLLAVLGAWLGWQMLPQVILLSAIVGTVIGVGMIIFRGHDKQIPIPFGPYLAIAGLIAVYFGPSINALYLTSL